MTTGSTNPWKAILKEQQIANAKRWLHLLQNHDHKARLILNDYENILRALEHTLQTPETFPLAYNLIQAIFTDSLGYADWERWQSYLNKAREQAATPNQAKEHARLTELLASLYYHQGNLKKAYTLGVQAAEEYLHIPARAEYARSLSQLALYADQLGLADESFQLIENAQQLAKTINDKQVLAASWLSLSEIHRRRRNWQQAMAAAEQAHTLYQQLQQTRNVLQSRLTMLHIWAEQGEWMQVEIIAKALSQDAALAGDLLMLCRLKNNLGIALFNQDRYQDAEKAWQEALQLQSMMHEPAELAGLYNNLGMVYTKLHEWETAETMLKAAAKIYKKLGDTYNWANALDNLADLYAAKGSTTAYHNTLKTAIDILTPLANIPHIKALLEVITQRHQNDRL